MSHAVTAILKKAKKLITAGNLSKAESLCNKILKKDPQQADALYLSGLIAKQRKQYGIAAQLITQAININPNRHIYHVHLGFMLHSAARLEEALTAYRHATRLKPDDIESHSIQANISNRLGRFHEVENSLRHVLRLKPNIAGAHCNLGFALREMGRLVEAEDSLRQALNLEPNYANAHCNLGLTLRGMGRLVEAEESLRRALELKPDLVEAYNTYGLVLMDLGRFDEAQNSLQRALQFNPGFITAHNNLLFVLAAGMRLSPGAMLEQQRRWDTVYGREGRMHPMPQRTTKPKIKKKLRIGYVSPDFRNNVVSYFFSPLLAAHDHNRFEIFCYANHHQDLSDNTTKRLQTMADHWRIVDTLSDSGLAKLIHEDAIDILVDLTGHLKGNRLKAFTYRPAPIQASYLGFIAATGLEAMDYWITDEVLHPADTAEQTVETIYRLPRCWVCYQAPDNTPDVTPCPNPDEQVTFGSFSNLSKLSKKVIETWSRLLHELPESHLLLMNKPLSDPKTRQRLVDQFASHNITADRLFIKHGAPLNEYLTTYAKVDIVLDPFPRTGGTTTAEALWMGVPVITLAGERYAERISASELTALGLEDLISNNQIDYIKKAVALAQDKNRRLQLRTTLRDRMIQSSLCDGIGLARAMETAYLTMWKQYVSENS